MNFAPQTIYPSEFADILIVDDEPNNLRVLSTILQDRGYRVRQALGGYTALKAAQIKPPSVILLDILMPGLGGYQVCEQLKQDTILADIPVIFLSALNRTEDKVKGFDVGGADYISKPFQIPEVLARIEHQLTLCCLQRQLREKNQELAAKNCYLQVEIAERQRIERQLRSSQAELQQQTQQLSDTLDKLQLAQVELVQGEKMSSLGQLAAGVAHEINNPINFIYGNLDYTTEYATALLEMIQLYGKHYPQPPREIQQAKATWELDFLMEDFPKVLSSMKVGVERIQKLVADLRYFIRIDSDHMEMADLHQGLDSALAILHHRLKGRNKGQAIAVKCDYGDIPPVCGYPGQLNQVFLNLLSNAIDAIEEKLAGGEAFVPAIAIKTQAIAENPSSLSPAKWVEICIADNGTGIPPQLKDSLFDHFFTTKPVGKGTGLGLSISYAIVVDRHRGQLQYHSELGQGTQFSIRLPLERDLPSQARS